MQYIWLIWSLILVVIWLIFYGLLGSKEEKKEMFIVSAWTSLLGLTEPFFVPEYWNPPSLFDLAIRTGFDIESLIFAFAAGGIVFVIYQIIFKKAHRSMTMTSMRGPRHRFHKAILWIVPVVALFLFMLTRLNPIYDFLIAGFVGGLAAWYCRPDLIKKMLTSALSFFILYYVYFLSLNIMSPGYVERVWNLKALSGIVVTGIPLEELLFSIMFGFYWSSVYEHLTWHEVT